MQRAKVNPPNEYSNHQLGCLPRSKIFVESRSGIVVLGASPPTGNPHQLVALIELLIDNITLWSAAGQLIH